VSAWVIGLSLCLVVLAGRLTTQRFGSSAPLLWLPAVVLGGILGVGVPRTPPAPPGLPPEERDDSYIGSAACAECHPAEYESFQATYHRSMTRRATDLAWDGQKGPRLPVEFDFEGRRLRLSPSPDGGAPVYDGPDLHRIARIMAAKTALSSSEVTQLFGAADRVTRRVAMTTGSHHYLALWIEDGDDRELRQFPFVFLFDKLEWAPRAEVFLQPPDSPPYLGRWNGSCIQCHAVGGMPREKDGHFSTTTAELGVACEACHGPARQHAEHYRSPWRRISAQPGASKGVISPERLSRERQNQLCGQCHSYFAPESPDSWWDTGFRRNEGPLYSGDSRNIELPGRLLLLADAPERAAAVGLSRDLSSIFWPDGSPMVGGREYSGIIGSACFDRSQPGHPITCLDCHSMHEAPASDQLKPDFEQACRNCHPQESRPAARHGGHSSSVHCADCHMPKTSYALMNALSSHKISIPDPASIDPPSACMLCHTDKSQTWLIGGVPPRKPTLSDADEPPLGMQSALAGHALIRALLADALAAPSAVQLTGPDYPRPILMALANDPYAVVRRIAQRSLAKLPPPGRGASGSPPGRDLQRSIEARDNRPITVSE
jgi:predicted CXXCH cytochrome family protein